MNIGTMLGFFWGGLYRDYPRDPLPHSPLSTSNTSKYWLVLAFDCPCRSSLELCGA